MSDAKDFAAFVQTLARYRYGLSRIRPHIAAVPLAALTPLHIQRAYQQLLTRYAPASVRAFHVPLARALGQAVRWGMIPASPAVRVDLPPAADAPQNILTAAQLAHLLATSASAGSRHWPLWTVIAHAGLRRNEALGLRWEDLVLDGPRPRLTVTGQQVRVGRQMWRDAPKSRKGLRVIPLTPAAVAALHAQRRQQDQERQQAGADWEEDGHGWVFRGVGGRVLHENAVLPPFRRELAAAGLPRIRLHDLRHTFASLLFAAGVHPKTASELLGHASTAITMNVYSHLLPGMTDAAMAAFAAQMPAIAAADAATPALPALYRVENARTGEDA